MQVILAYALFILLMAAPFIVAAVLVSGFLAGFSIALRGLAAGQTATAVLGVALSVPCIAGILVGGRWSMRGKASEATLVEVSPVTSAMSARPRVFVLGLESGWQDVLEILSGDFDRIESTRRYAPGLTTRGARTIDEYGRWLAEWQLVTVVDREAVLRGEGMKATRLTPLDRQSRLPHFGINRRYDPARPNYILYYFDGITRTELSRCELELRLPPALAFLPRGQVAFMRSATYQDAMKHLRACRRTMLKRLASDLADKAASATGAPADST